MLAEERLNEILTLVEKKKTVSVQELVKVLDTSESTIRRNLTLLHRKGKEARLHHKEQIKANSLRTSRRTNSIKEIESYDLYGYI